MRKGDSALLHAFAFLFFRFQPECYWYVLVLLVRNACVTLVPVISGGSFALCALAIILLLCVTLGSCVQAIFWGVGINVGFLLIIFLGALFTDTSNQPLVTVMLLVISSSVLLLLICVACHCVLTLGETLSMLPLSSQIRWRLFCEAVDQALCEAPTGHSPSVHGL